MNSFTKPIIGFALPLLMLGGTAQAASVSAFFEGVNDCSGYFGQGFPNCVIFVGEGEDRVELSPVISKFENDDDDGLEFDEGNPGFGSIDGSEWSFTNIGENKTGTWTYAPDDDEDPAIRFWTAKAAGGGSSGGGFNLFWDIGDAAQSATCMEDGADNYNLACLSLAMAVTTGGWETPNEKGLSHLTFYDSISEIPVPAAFWLFGTALIGFIGFSRRTKV